MYDKESKENIFESSIRNAVSKILDTDDEAYISHTFKLVSELLAISIGKMTTKEQLKDYIAKKIEEH